MQNNRDHASLSCIMSFHCSLLDLITFIRCNIIGAYQQEDDPRIIQMLFDFLLPITSCNYVAIVPGGDQALSLQSYQSFFQLVTQFFVLMGVGEENLDCF